MPALIPISYICRDCGHLVSGKRNTRCLKCLYISRKGVTLSPLTCFKKRMISWNKGKPMTDELRKKISLAKRGKERKGDPQKWKHSESARKKISKGLSGRKLSDSAIEKLRTYTGDKSSQWKGGISKMPYSNDWTATLRKSIRERDNYTCRVCSAQQGDCTFHVHHIDYDKKNCDPNNLITLCPSCHIKTNSNRPLWLKYFKTILCYFQDI